MLAMKTALILWAMVALSAVPQALAEPAGDATAAIAATLDRFGEAASRADETAYFALLAPDSVFIGTDAGERWTLPQFKAYVGPLFAKGHGWTYVARERHITLAPIPCGCVAWFDELLDNPKYGTSRGTGVVIATPDGWKIEQYVLTFPIPNDLAGEMTKTIRDYEAKARAAKP
jgi:hypothetical protein